MVERETWNPWRALRDRPELLFALVDLEPGEGDGFYWPLTSGQAVIGVSRRLDQTERRAVLAHELLHHERGGGSACSAMPDMWDAVVARDEEAVEEAVAARLVPPAQLAALLATLADFGHSPDLWEIAEHFAVPEHVAARALELLAREGYGERWAG